MVKKTIKKDLIFSLTYSNILCEGGKIRMNNEQKLMRIQAELAHFRKALSATKEDKIPLVIHSKEQNRDAELTISRSDLVALVETWHNRYLALLQNTCTHSLWYFLENKQDIYGSTLWTCKCLDCGTEKTAPFYEFQDQVVLADTYFGQGERSTKDYYLTYLEYQFLKQSGILENEVAHYIIKKHTLGIRR